jgi:hypothetical protein
MALLCGWCAYDTANTHEVKLSWWVVCILFIVWTVEHLAAALDGESA